MKEVKTYYFIWDSNDIDRMVRILTNCGTNEDIIEQIIDLDLKDGTAVVPYTNGYSTYYGFDLDKSEYELIEDVESDDTEDEPTEDDCRHCGEPECRSRKAEYKPENRPEVTEVDIDDDLDDYEVTEDIDEAMNKYSRFDPDYEEALDDLRILLHVRDEYRSAEEDAILEVVGEFKEGDYISYDFSILSTEDGFKVVETEYPSVFSFATEKMAQKFLDIYEELIENVSETIGYFM